MAYKHRIKYKSDLGIRKDVFMTRSYHSFLHKILEYYGQEEYDKALKYLNDHRDEVNGIDSQIDNFCIFVLLP